MLSGISRWLRKSVQKSLLKPSCRRRSVCRTSEVLEVKALLAFNGFSSPTHYQDTNGRPILLATGDLTGDGFDDVLTDAQHSQGRMSTWLSNGSGGLTAGPFIGTSNFRATFHHLLIDMDNDGRLDAVVPENASITIGKGNGNGTFFKTGKKRTE